MKLTAAQKAKLVEMFQTNGVCMNATRATRAGLVAAKVAEEFTTENGSRGQRITPIGRLRAKSFTGA